MLMLFDAPDSLQGLAARSSTTTVAPQALMLMNNPQVREYARAFAGRLLPGAGASPDEAIERAYRIALGPPAARRRAGRRRWPSSRQQADSYRAAGQAEPLAPALADFCQVLMGLNEFIYID